VLHSFGGGGDGNVVTAGLILDGPGNLYGTTEAGGIYGHGVVFELTPNLDGSWKEIVLHSFTGGKDGAIPKGGLILDGPGNLYGTTKAGGTYGNGVVFELTPNPDGSWKEKVLHSFTGGKDGRWPYAGVISDQAGNLYGTTCYGGASGYGVAFRLMLGSDGKWRERVLHAFIDHPGACPRASLIRDASGNLYGTTWGDMSTTFGSVFEITP